jgi:CheY-like chemotaxis protein
MARVLVVDDESASRFYLTTILEGMGHRVIEAHHGAAALERARASTPDVVITDLMMPVMNGHELIEQLRSDPLTAAIPIIAVSTNPIGATSADATFGKPVPARELLETVTSLATGSV